VLVDSSIATSSVAEVSVSGDDVSATQEFRPVGKKEKVVVSLAEDISDEEDTQEMGDISQVASVVVATEQSSLGFILIVSSLILLSFGAIYFRRLKG
jgi:hypothetical protein